MISKTKAKCFLSSANCFLEELNEIRLVGAFGRALVQRQIPRALQAVRFYGARFEDVDESAPMATHLARPPRFERETLREACCPYWVVLLLR